MGFFDPTFILGLILLLYLSSFVVFAILRIATGVSIQRIGYFSLRHIAYTPRDGVKLEIRGLGVRLHRPTFGRPTWLSLRMTELKVTIDPNSLSLGNEHHGANHQGSPGASEESGKSLQRSAKSPPKPILRLSHAKARGRTWNKLQQLKDRLKRLHEKIHLLRLVDVVASNTTCIVVDIATIEVGHVSLAVDTRRQTVDRGRLFQHKKIPEGDQRPAEWMFLMRNALFTPEGKESLEILDNCSINIHGLLYKDLAGLRDSSISLKLGRIHIPYDDLAICYHRVQNCLHSQTTADVQSPGAHFTFTDVIEELDMPGSRQERLVQTVSDSKEFVSSILRGIQEVQVAVSFIGVSKEFRISHSSGSLLYLNMAMNEFGVDMHRLDQKSPAHRMYFSSKDIAHQALLAVISIGASLDYGAGKPERILYVPMVTTTIKTTLPSKTVTFSEDKDAAERNANILFANLVVTSPSVDLDPKHVPIILGLVQSRQPKSQVGSSSGGQHRHLISRLLPKASIKVSVHEPVIRVVLPPADRSLKDTDEYDILICCISSISLDVESSHSAAGELHYSLVSNLRVSSNQLYYQLASGERHNLLMTDLLDLRAQVTANPELRVTASGNIQTFSMHMVRPEISAGVRQIVQHAGGADEPEMQNSAQESRITNFLRPLPPWLEHFQFQGSNFGVEVAGVDSEVSDDTRGLALQLESWTAEYKIQKDTVIQRPPSRRHGQPTPATGDAPSITVTGPSGVPKSAPDSTDGRRLAIHVRGFEGFVVEGLDIVEPESFLSLPRFEVAFSTSSDANGPIFHLNSHIKAFRLHYSLYRYYAIGVAVMVLRRAFAVDHRRPKAVSPRHSADISGDKADPAPGRPTELFTVDVKSEIMQFKATMPSDPPMMLQIHGVETGRHRWAVPFLRSRLIRLYVQAPQAPQAWARVATVKNLRFDLRELRRKHAKQIIDEKSIDIATDFIRLAVPHQLTPHKIFDNFVNAVKATEQLHHRFKTGTNEYILNKGPEKPKIIPRISIRTKALTVELEDGPFEWKLGTIYRTGLVEQKQRLARHEAFLAKVKQIEEQQRHGSSRYRTQSANPSRNGREKSQKQDAAPERSRSTETRKRRRSLSPASPRARRMRYDPEGSCGLTGSAKISAQDAWNKLQRYNASSWKRRIDAFYHIQRDGMRDIRSAYWGDQVLPEGDTSFETILSMPDRPSLMSATVSDLLITFDKPSFPVNEYAEFLHKAGKGMPRNMEYSLLIPVGLQLKVGEARVGLRDYPLPLFHIPPIRPGQSPRLPSWSLTTDFVIAEEYRGPESSKQQKVEVVPQHKFSDHERRGGFAIDVRRTISPVKTYSDIEVVVNTSAPTSITWGTSYQPAIQDMMMIIEGFTKPQADPSDRVGFWDKIRLNVHSRANVQWKGDGDVHLKLKGSRDPYVVTGHGAGFVMCWRNGIRWGIHQNDDPKQFMEVTSGEYVLAIPDYSHQAREKYAETRRDGDSISSRSSIRSGALFKKVIMKLSGNVRWLAGLVLERDTDNGGRSFDFKPHYEVILRNPEQLRTPPGKDYDAFRGFRSNHIHLSIAVAAPLDRDWAVTNIKPSLSYNAVHLSPRFFTHFLDWWSLFSGVMSLPIRQGSLFPGIDKSSKKFGRHLATIKYSLLLSPLFIAHIYKHKDGEDYSDESLSATGIKIRLDSFMLDLHQRREEFRSPGKGRTKQMKTSGMRINQTQLDLIGADFRAVSASIAGTTSEDLKRATDEDLAAFQEPAMSTDMSRFTIPDNDFSWIDMDDFVELDWILPAETNPETKIMPLAYAPHFTYFRQTEHHGTVAGDAGRSSPFGNEPTHECIMVQDNDPRRVQCDLIKDRIAKVDEQIKTHQRTLGEQELRVVRDGNRDSSLKDRFEMLSEQGKLLEGKKRFLQGVLYRLTERIRKQKGWADSDDGMYGHDFDPQIASYAAHSSKVNEAIDTAPLQFVPDFDNRFIIHNAQVKWNNSLRNIILRYVHQVSQRRGLIYYMSRRAVKFILDIVDEQSKRKHKPREPSPKPSTTDGSSTTRSDIDEQVDSNVEDRIQELLSDGRQFVDADDPAESQGLERSTTGNLDKDISPDFTALNSYHLRLIAPQIQLQSEKNSKSVLLVAAKGMALKVIQIMDKERVGDDVSGLVQRRFSVDMDSVQFFTTNQKSLTQFIHLYSGNRYGSPKGSAWPPWVPYEVNFDFELNPFGWSRVVQKTSASLRYDKYNNLRLKYNEEIAGGSGHPRTPENKESRIDRLWVDFPQIRAVCDSTQYFAMYVIVLDLLLYSEPLEKVRSERLEKIMLASDFSDLRGAPEMVISLQERKRQLEEIKTYFGVHAKYLDRQGWQDRLSIEHDITRCEDELFFIMKAITTSQRKTEDRGQATQSNGLLRWYLTASEIVWHLVREKSEPLMEIQLQNALYDRTDNSDGSNHNTMAIERMHGLNLLPEALYPEMLAPFSENGKNFTGGQDSKMLKVDWHMLEAIAGIPVLDHFEVNLFPLKVQLEREVGKKLFEYIFPGVDSKGGDFSPFMVKQSPTQDEEDNSDEDVQPSISESTTMDTGSSDDLRNGTTTRSLEKRLRPTRALTGPMDSSGRKSKKVVLSGKNETHHFRLFHNSSHPPTSTTSSLVRTSSSKGRSQETLHRSSNDGSYSNLSSLNGHSEKEKHKRFTLNRTSSRDTLAEKGKPSDDITQMMSRASSYMTLAYVKIPSVVLCLSYKGRGERNIEDVHNFVFRMPVLEYRNKTWSNLDLALRLKKDVIKALISHTGAIIGNKLSHRPNKSQLTRLRDIANASSLLPNSSNVNSVGQSETSSMFDDRSTLEDEDAYMRASSTLTRTDSCASSLRSETVGTDQQEGEQGRPPTSHSADDESSHTFMPRFARRFTSDGRSKSAHRDSSPSQDHSEDGSHKSKPPMRSILGKKILGSLNNT